MLVPNPINQGEEIWVQKWINLNSNNKTSTNHFWQSLNDEETETKQTQNQSGAANNNQHANNDKKNTRSAQMREQDELLLKEQRMAAQILECHSEYTDFNDRKKTLINKELLQPN